MLLGMSLVDARRLKNQWRATGDYYYCKKAHNALRSGVRAAMKASGLDCTRQNESTALIAGPKLANLTQNRRGHVSAGECARARPSDWRAAPWGRVRMGTYHGHQRRLGDGS